MNEEEFEKMNDKRYANKEELEKVKYCGCVCCHSFFKTELIKEWIKEDSLYISDGKGNMKIITEGYTAKCPYCEEDNVIPLTNEYEYSKMFLRRFLAYECQKNEDKIIIQEHKPAIITYEEVTERLKNKRFEDYTYTDVFDRYVAYGEDYELAQVEVQKLFIKHGMIEELLFVAPRNIITDKEVIDGILSSNINIYAPMGEFGAIRGTLESTEIVTDEELPQGASWLYLNFRAEQFWNVDTKSWDNFQDGISHTKYRYMYYEDKQKPYKEEIDKDIGKGLIVIIKYENSTEQYNHLCCMLKNENITSEE